MVLTRSGRNYEVVDRLRKRLPVEYDPTIPEATSSALFHENVHVYLTTNEGEGDVRVRFGFCTVPIRQCLTQYGNLKDIQAFCCMVVHHAALLLREVHGLDLQDFPCVLHIDRLRHGVPTHMPFMMWEIEFDGNTEHIGQGPHPGRLTPAMCFHEMVQELRPVARRLNFVV